MIKATDCIKLENDRNFKKKYIALTSWWKSILVIPSILILFLGLFGMIYLLNFDQLVSYYTIPFAIIFLLGTIWFKSVKRHIYNTLLNDPNGCKVCIASPVCTEEGYTYLVFVNGQKRHNEHFIRQFSETMASENSASLIKECKRKPIILHNNDLNIDYCLIAFLTRNIKKQNAMWKEAEPIPLIYVNDKNAIIIKGKDLA